MDAADLTKFAGQKVIAQVKLDKPNEKGETLVEVEGTALAANEMGILLKPKGKTQAELIEAAKLEGVEFAPEKPKEIKAKTLQHVTYGNARTHLLERHGIRLTEANSLSEASALEYHTGLDHVEANLGHVHGDKTQTERAQAIEGEQANGENATAAAPAA